MACYCLGSSLLRKGSGGIVGMPLRLDSYVPVGDTVMLWIM